MTVRELIIKLNEFPPDAVVVVNMGKNELANERTVKSVRVVRACASASDPEEWTTLEFTDKEWLDPGQKSEWGPEQDVVDLSSGA